MDQPLETPTGDVADTVTEPQPMESQAAEAARTPCQQPLPMALFAAIGVALIINIGIGARIALQQAEKPQVVKARAVGLRNRESHAAKALHHRVTYRGKALHAQLDAVDARVVQWKADLEALLTSEAGRRIAAEPQRVAAFIAMRNASGREERSSERIRRHLNRILSAEVADDAEDFGGWDRSTLDALHLVEDEIRSLAAELERRREEIETLTAGPQPAASQSLQASIAETKERWAQESLDAMVAAQTAEIKKLDAYNVRRARDKAKLERLKKECQDQQVLSVLQPFITPSHRLDRYRHEAKARYSHIYLQDEGVLESDRLGYLRLVRCAVQTDAPSNLWANLMSGPRIVPESWNAQQLRFVQNAQELLRKYGPALVSLGLLEP